MLAVTWGIKRMSLYLHGLPMFTVSTDHKPLVPILNYKSLVDMSPRIQRLRMKLLQYSFKAEHVPGKELLDSDAFSRSPVEDPSIEDELAEKEVQVYVDAVFNELPASAGKLEEIKECTRDDSLLMEVIRKMKEGWPELRKNCNKIVQPYWTYRDEITVVNGILLRGNRIIVPTKLRAGMLKLIHEGHFGMEKCKRRARQCLFWPEMNH